MAQQINGIWYEQTPQGWMAHNGTAWVPCGDPTQPAAPLAPPAPPAFAPPAAAAAPAQDFSDDVVPIPPSGLPAGRYDFEVEFTRPVKGVTNDKPWEMYEWTFTVASGEERGRSVRKAFFLNKAEFRTFATAANLKIEKLVGADGISRPHLHAKSADGNLVSAEVFEDAKGYDSVKDFKAVVSQAPQTFAPAPAPVVAQPPAPPPQAAVPPPAIQGGWAPPPPPPSWGPQR